MNLIDELHAIVAALRAAGIRYAVCGGLAVTIHGAMRTTKDIDLLIAGQDVQRAIELLRPLGYVFAALPMTFDAGTPRERRVQRVSKIIGNQTISVDLLEANAAFAGLLDDIEDVVLPEGPLVVISQAGLITMKQLAGRPQDLVDLERLAGVEDE